MYMYTYKHFTSFIGIDILNVVSARTVSDVYFRHNHHSNRRVAKQ